jgi:hypothetical protein
VVKDGQYGSPRRQRYRCVGQVVNPVTGEVRPFHRFVPPLPKERESRKSRTRPSAVSAT